MAASESSAESVSQSAVCGHFFAHNAACSAILADDAVIIGRVVTVLRRL